MTIGSEIAACNVDVARTFNSLATFTPAVGSAVSLRVDLDKGIDPQPVSFDSRAWNTRTTIEALLTDLPHQPNKTETFTISGTIYTVQEIVADDGYFVTMAVK